MRRRLTLTLALGLTLALPGAAIAGIDGIPGATYTGTASDGATITFTVSPDGTIVDQYSITGVSGAEPSGGTCQFTAAGDNGVWEGAPIEGNVFAYNLGDAIILDGSFTGPQAASGSFRLYDAAAGSDPSCDTGTVSWTATTSSPPRGGSPGSKLTVLTTIVLHRRGSEKFVGSLRTSSGACRVKRRVSLVAGRKRLARMRTSRHGSFTFVLRKVPNKYTLIRASVSEVSTASVLCAPASSKFITIAG
jgi:hypothetical protein